ITSSLLKSFHRRDSLINRSPHWCICTADISHIISMKPDLNYLSIPFVLFLVCALFPLNVWLFPPTERLLRLDREERRKDYRRPEFIPLDKIPTWREENKPDDKEEEEGTELTGLTDKVSLYKGDITVLEVDAIVNAGKNQIPIYIGRYLS
uniref:Macro domain-containing protein n=1 Tax=Labrus bergylta TaxID=56723 RepID=A0A3Q3KTM6_9LABR